MKKRVTSTTDESGVVLVVSLIMLLLVTIIGLSGSQVTSLEEKMANNRKDQNLAFQAAEAALRGGEDNIESIVALSAFNGTSGLLGKDDAVSDFSSSGTWSASNSKIFDTSSSLVTTQPRYFIKYLTTGEITTGASINMGGYGESSAGAAVSFFTVISRGTGGQDTSQVYLKSYFGKRF
ncbi:MAG: pilus assembly protein PilX [Methylococcales bacterium]|nr:pilus assembly protein PilX [Methylococcales bacterium]